jgi:hypothetical protein
MLLENSISKSIVLDFNFAFNGRLRCRWVDSIKIDLRESGWDHMDWFDLAQDRD